MKKFIVINALVFWCVIFHHTSTAKISFSIATYNTKLIPVIPCSPFNKELCDPYRRASLIPDNFKDYDIVSFQELFSNAADKTIKTLMNQQGFYHTSRNCESFLSKITGRYIFSGGVRLFSRHPILESDYLTLPRSSGIECLSAKGVVYAKVQHSINGQILHFFTTHMQSSCEDIPDESLEKHLKRRRSSQLHALKKFIDKKNIPANEVIFVLGDFNIHKGDFISRELRNRTIITNNFTCEFKTLLQILNAVNIGKQPDTTLPYSYNTVDNYMTSLAHHVQVQSSLDHILCVKKTNNGISHPCKFNNPVLTTLSLRDEDNKNDLSDHNPVTLTFDITSDYHQVF